MDPNKALGIAEHLEGVFMDVHVDATLSTPLVKASGHTRLKRRQGCSHPRICKSRGVTPKVVHDEVVAGKGSIEYRYIIWCRDCKKVLDKDITPEQMKEMRNG